MATKKTQATESVVAYVGTSHVREIDHAAWNNAGVADQNKVVWDSSNGHEIPVSSFNESALQYIYQNDDEFEVREPATSVSEE